MAENRHAQDEKTSLPENLNDHQLNLKIKELIRKERALTQEVIEHLAEVDERRLYLRLNYDSFYSYLRNEIGYPEGSAQRRIDAVRLFRRVPEISTKIVDGSINLSQITKIQKLCRQVRQESHKPVAVQTQKDILSKLENQDAKNTDLILAREFGLEIKVSEKKKIQRDESVRIEFTFSKEEMEIIGKAQALLSNKTGGNLKNTVLEMAKLVIKAKTSGTTAGVTTIAATDTDRDTNAAIDTDTGEESIRSSTATVAVKKLKTLTPRLKRQILARDQVCQFKDDKTGQICGSRFFLQIDHIKPRFAQGPHTPENLRAMCKNHNIFRYQEGI